MLDELRNLVAAGQLGEAEPRLDAYLRRRPEDPEASTLLGILHMRTGRLDSAAKLLAVGASGGESRVEALTWLAAVRKGQGLPEEAIPLLQQVLEVRSDDQEAFNLLGVCCLSIGRAEEAESAFRSALSLVGESAPLLSNIGMSLRLQNRGIEALAAFEAALTLDSSRPQAYLQVFKQQQQLAQWDAALATLKRGLCQHPGSLRLTEALAVAYGRLNQTQLAEETFETIFRSDPSAANIYAQWLQEQGRFEDSIPVLRTSLQLQPVQGAPYRNLAEAKVDELDGVSLLDLARSVSIDPRLDREGQMHLSYALGRLHERSGNYGAAMEAFDQANELAFRTYPACQSFDPDWTAREVRLVSTLYSSGFMERISAFGSPDSRPVFIVGMVRSGTTLLDQMISAHPEVASTGEGTFWNAVSDTIHRQWSQEEPTGPTVLELAHRYLATVEPEAARFTDKMPLNYRNLGLIHVAFPNSKIVHIRRDPFDTCLSIYTTFFGGGPSFTYHPQHIVAFYNAYLQYMEHWRRTIPPAHFHEVDYELLVTATERTTKAVIDFLGLKWDESCLRPEANSGQVSTPSRWQARQPIYTGSVGKRERYAKYAPALAQLPMKN